MAKKQQNYEMTSGWNIKMIKWQADETAKWLNGKLLKQQNDLITSRWNRKIMKCKVDETSKWLNGNLMEQQVNKTTWPNYELAKFEVDKMSSCQNCKLM